MSIGGIVIEVYNKDDKMHVITRDKALTYSTHATFDKSYDIRFGDKLLWNKGQAHWNPAESPMVVNIIDNVDCVVIEPC